MSAILAIVGPNLPPDGVVRRMLGAMSARGNDRAELWRGPDAVLAVSRDSWQTAPEFAGDTMVLDAGDCVVVADASIYYRADLRAALASRGVVASADLSTTELVLAAYRAWGEAAAEHIEGDFAFVVWDRRTKRVTCSRDFAGKRPLHYAVINGVFVAASLASGVVAHPDCPSEINAVVLAETLAQFWQGGDDTAYAAVKELLGARTCTWSTGSEVRVVRNWTPPEMGEGPATSFEEGAAELRRLLMAATSERMAQKGITAIWMSGGWDSPSVFGAGQAVLENDRRGRELRPVSISYPVGDPGREDELITSISNHWKAPVEWIDVDSIPLIDRPVEGGRSRDLPFAHTYEHWNRRLSAASRGVGARIAFDGNGGDQLFAVSDAYLSDLLREGRWLELARDWRGKGGGTFEAFAAYALAPSLPRSLVRGIQRVRGRYRSDYLERGVPAWIRPEFARAHRLREREQENMGFRPGDHGWRREARMFLSSAAFSRVFGVLGGFGLENGIELRSPLLDRRVAEFACGRPREERNSGRETKRLLRAAMAGLLPDHVLAPRKYRTGITSKYSDRQIRASFPDLMHYLTDDPVLGELGVIDVDQVRASWDRFLRTRLNSLKIPLFLTLHVELWLRARLRPEQKVKPAIAPKRVPAGAR